MMIATGRTDRFGGKIYLGFPGWLLPGEQIA
jgi:hypothetical protein